MKISEAAKLTGLNVSSIRFYERKVSAKYSCGFSNLLDSSIIVNER